MDSSSDSEIGDILDINEDFEGEKKDESKVQIKFITKMSEEFKVIKKKIKSKKRKGI